MSNRLTDIVAQLTPRVLAAASRHPGDRDLRAAVDLLATVPAAAASDERLRAELGQARAAGKEFPSAAPVRPQPSSPTTADEVDVTALPPLVTPGPLTDPALVDSHADADIVNRYTGGAR
jgi:hypothetical protein